MGKNEEVTALDTPFDREIIEKLKVGDLIKISGRMITARDKVYGRILKFLEGGEKLPIKLENETIYHCGPLARKEDDTWKVISAGPTTSARLDEVQGEFVEKTGVRALIGKGGVGQRVAEEIAKLGCVYLSFTGGAGALAAKSIESVEKVLWRDLGLAEAMWVLKVKDFGPLVVGVDTKGNNIY